MKPGSRSLFLLLALALALLNPAAAQATRAGQPGEMAIAATIFPIADIVRHITGPGARVVQILPAGASPHTFDLTPSQLRELQGCRLIFKIGGIDDWIDGIGESLPRAAVVSLQKNIPLLPFHEDGHDHGRDAARGHEEFDPHYWLSAANGVVMARNIADALAAADPARASAYDANFHEYARELAALHRELTAELSRLKSRKMIVFHDAWRYFAAAYGLEIAAVFQSSPGREPSPRDLKDLYAMARGSGIRALFSEPQLPASSLEPMLEDLGLRVVVLDPLGGTSPGDSYIRLLRRNARAVRLALDR